MASLDSLRSEVEGVTRPVPRADTHALLELASLEAEHTLLRNGQQLQRWTAHLAQGLEAIAALVLTARALPQPEKLGPLATVPQRLGLQKIVDLHERALEAFPTHFPFWAKYLALRSAAVLGTAALKHQLDIPRKKVPVKHDILHYLTPADLTDQERDIDRDWSGHLDPVLGYQEWLALAAVHERALMYLPNMPRLWLSYLTIFTHPHCPAPLAFTHARKTFDRALKTLPVTLHERIWRIYLVWAENCGGATAVRVWRRYLKMDPAPTHHYVKLLLALSPPRPLEAAKLILSLSRRAAAGTYKDPEGKSPYQLLGEWLEICEKYPEETGVDAEQSAALREEREKAEKERLFQEGEKVTAGAAATELVRVGENGDAATASTSAAKYDPSVDPLSTELFDVEHIVRNEGIALYKDQAGRLWTGLGTYWIKRGDFDLANDTFEQGLNSVLTLRDFTQIFDAFAEFQEEYLSALMDGLKEEVEEGEEEERKEEEKELEEKMRTFEELMDRRPFLVNEVLLRRNQNDVQEWEKRIALYGDDDEKVAETYAKALKTIVPRKATANYHSLWVHYAKFYETGGVASASERDLPGARKVFEKAVGIAYKRVEELAEIWCEWAEMEVRNENYDEAIKVMQRATAVPRKINISFHDQSLSVQTRLFKSLKLWSFYVDLEESLGTIESTKAVYNKIFELKIANAQIVINFANFLEENQFWEESFKVYERGVDLFTYPISFEIWNTYLSKFIKRYGGDKIERARDLFEQALENCPTKFAKPLFLMYGQLEEEFGLAKRAMSVYDRATSAVDNVDKMEMFTYYIAKATANFGLPATRPIYERAIETLPDKQTAEMCLRFAALERKLGEIDRARAIFAHASQFCDPRSNPNFWATWNAFEIETGSEDTFREFLRIKRAVQSAFNTESSYIAARTAVAVPGVASTLDDSATGADPMAMLDAETTGGDQVVSGFVKAKETGGVKAVGESEPTKEVGNNDEINLDDD